MGGEEGRRGMDGWRRVGNRVREGAFFLKVMEVRRRRSSVKLGRWIDRWGGDGASVRWERVG